MKRPKDANKTITMNLLLLLRKKGVKPGYAKLLQYLQLMQKTLILPD